jgi:copper resistance protein D
MTDWGLVAIRFALYADLMLLVGLSAFPLYSFTRSEREDGAILPLGGKLLGLALAALPLSAAGFAISSAAMMGVAIAALDVSTLASMAGDTDQGAAFLVRMAALVTTLAALVLLPPSQTPRYAASMVGGSIALATLVWSGHAAATEGALGVAHRISDIAHMIAAALWIGAIVAFCLLFAHPAKGEAHVTVASRSLANFARVGTVAVAIIMLTGLFNGYAILGADITTLFQSTYGLLLAAKLVLFAAMLSLAANNRWRLMPALEHAAASDYSESAWTRLRISVALEAAASATVLALVAWLGTLAPAN